MKHDERSTHEEQRDPGSVVQDMVREDRAQSRQAPSAGATASADAVEALRRSLRDLKHDVRMLKVSLDKQSKVLDDLARAVDGLRSERARDG